MTDLEQLLRELADDLRMPQELGVKLHDLIDAVVLEIDETDSEGYQRGYDDGERDAPSEAEIRAEILYDIDSVIDSLWCSVTPLPERSCDWRRVGYEPWASLAEMVAVTS